MVLAAAGFSHLVYPGRMDLSGWARLLVGGAKFVGALGRLFAGGSGSGETQRAPSEAELRNQRQEQSAGAARNYSSRRTERAAHAKRDTAEALGYPVSSTSKESDDK